MDWVGMEWNGMAEELGIEMSELNMNLNNKKIILLLKSS